jgi:hypothetical protein
VRVTYITG